MTVSDKTFLDIFSRQNHLRIPFFQRGYVWGKDNWERFFDEILDNALENQTKDNNGNPVYTSMGEPLLGDEVYFLGSIILKKAANGCFEVIDGQQRLTTIVMYMKALLMVCGRNDLFDDNFYPANFAGNRTEVLEVNFSDKPLYDDIIKQDVLHLESLPNGKLKDCYEYFVHRFNEIINECGRATLNLIYYNCIKNVKIVVIEVTESENAQKIFDTINSAGIKLTTGEMLKNYLFNEDMKDLYERIWRPLFENGKKGEFWDGDLTSGRTKEAHIEGFFYRYLQIKIFQPQYKDQLSTQEIKNLRKQDGLFEKFKRFIVRFNLDKETEINEIVRYANLYYEHFNDNVLEETIPLGFGVDRLTYIMKAQNVWTMAPYIMYILNEVKDSTERNKIFKYMEIYLMRRIICKSNNNSYSDLFTENLIGQQIKTYEGFRDYISNDEGRDNLLIPSDDDVRMAVTKNRYSNQHVILILYMLESLMSGFNNSQNEDNGFLEFKSVQIMPEKISENWPLDPEYTPEQRATLVNTLGNQVLVRSKLSKKAQASDWKTKCNLIRSDVSGLDLFNFIGMVNRGEKWAKERWTEKDIVKLNEWLSDQIIEKWPLDKSAN